MLKGYIEIPSIVRQTVRCRSIDQLSRDSENPNGGIGGGDGGDDVVFGKCVEAHRPAMRCRCPLLFGLLGAGCTACRRRRRRRPALPVSFSFLIPLFPNPPSLRSS